MRSVRYNPPTPQREIQNGAVGVLNSLDPQASRPNTVRQMLNCYPDRGRAAGAWVGRPGFKNMGQALTGPVQWMDEWRDRNGVRRVSVVSGGRYGEYDELDDTFTMQPTATFSPSGDVYGVPFLGNLILHDSIGKPYQFDGTSWTMLSDAPVAYGKPAVYAGKVFFINKANRREIQWSEEGDATIGYTGTSGALTFDNVWELIQTDSDFLVALVATEDALFVCREGSIGALYGLTGDDLRSTSTRNAVSETVGVAGPRAVALVERSVYFVDREGSPHIFEPGVGVRSLDGDLSAVLPSLDQVLQDRAVVIHDESTGMVLMGVVQKFDNAVSRYLVFDSETSAYCGEWNGWRPSMMAVVRRLDGAAVLVHGTTAGNVYIHGRPLETLWNDNNRTVDGGVKAIPHRVQSLPMDFSIRSEKTFFRLDLLLRALTSMTGVQVTVKTPNAVLFTRQFTLDGGAAIYDVSVYDDPQSRYAGPSLEVREAVAFNAVGRWLEVTIDHAQLGEQFGWLGWEVEFASASDQPRAQ